MLTITVRNVHEALAEGVYQLTVNGVSEDTRNGPVKMLPLPVTTHYLNPRERVLFWAERDANPFFHFYEALWMLGGRNDVASLTRFVKTMKQFSDNGETFHGAYGHRWRHHFCQDQIQVIILNLRTNPSCRRQVLQMYDTHADGHYASVQNKMKDIPCNLAAHFMVRGGALDMTVFNRSNDMVWGAYGANAVHFSMLQEVVATLAGLPVGMYWQVSDNFHAYEKTLEPLLGLADRACQPPSHGTRTPYEGEVTPFPMVNGSDWDTWFSDLDMFLDEGLSAMGYRDVFFRRVALPILKVHDLFKAKQYAEAWAACVHIKATDWRLAIEQWLERREAKRESRKSTT